MSKLIRRIWSVALLLGATQAALLWGEYRFVPEPPETVAQNLGELPLQLGRWQGEETVLDEKTFRAIGGDQTIQRHYRMPGTRGIMMTTTQWTDRYRGIPHPPSLCYSVGGWRIVKKHKMDVGPEGAKSQPAQILTCERQGNRAMVLYWFQMGPHTYYDRNGLRDVRRRYWGRTQWPPMCRVLLHTEAGDLGRAEKRLRDLAERVYNWLRRQQQG